MKNYTIAIALIASGIIGTTTYYETVDAPSIPQDSVRYEKVDDDTYKKYTITVREETFKASEAPDFIHLLNVSMQETQNSEDPVDQKKFAFASSTKAEKIQELETVRGLGITIPTYEN